MIKFLLLLISISLCLVAYEIKQFRHLTMDYLTVQTISINNKLEYHRDILNGLSDRLRAQSNYEDELGGRIDKIQGVISKNFKRRKKL